jgi:hypothetical protein
MHYGWQKDTKKRRDNFIKQMALLCWIVPKIATQDAINLNLPDKQLKRHRFL